MPSPTSKPAQKHHASRAVGVDIDDTLVRAAWRHRRTVWSLQAPDEDSPSGDALGKRKRDSPALPEADYFPASCEHFFGPIPVPPSELRGKTAFPHNVSFRTADWTTESIPEDEEGYDVVLAYVLFSFAFLIVMLCICELTLPQVVCLQVDTPEQR